MFLRIILKEQNLTPNFLLYFDVKRYRLNNYPRVIIKFQNKLKLALLPCIVNWDKSKTF